MYCCLCCLLFAAVPVGAENDTLSVQEIDQNVLGERAAIKSGIISFSVKTNVDIQQPIAEKIGLKYTVYFKDGNFRMDEERRLVDGKVVKYWSVYAFGRCLRSYGDDDPILVGAAAKRKYSDLGIINPLMFGLTATPIISGAMESNIVYLRLPEQVDCKAERDIIDGVSGWKVTNTYKEHRLVYWVAPQFNWSLVKSIEYIDDRVRTELVCPAQAYDNGHVYFPREVVLRRFNVGNALEYEEVTSVIEASFNIDVPNDLFAMNALGIPAGTKVIDDNMQRVWNGDKLITPIRTFVKEGELPTTRKPTISIVMLLFCVLFILLGVFMLRMHRRLKRMSSKEKNDEN